MGQTAMFGAIKRSAIPEGEPGVIVTIAVQSEPSQYTAERGFGIWVNTDNRSGCRAKFLCDCNQRTIDRMKDTEFASPDFH